MYDVAPEHAAALTAGIFTAFGLLLLLVTARHWQTHLTIAAMRRYDSVPPAGRLAAALMLIAGVVHLVLIAGHVTTAPVTAALFLINGAGFIALAAAVFTSRGWRKPAAFWLLATLSGYVVWVIAGWETPDQVGVATTLIELLALGLVMKLAEPRRYSWPRRAWRAWRLAVMTVTLTIGTWIGGLAHPDSQHAHFAAVLQAVPDTATRQQVAGAAELLAGTRASLARYATPAAAEAAGYRSSSAAFEKLMHYENDGNRSVILDPNHPQALVYARSPHGSVLVGAMFAMPELGQTGPDPGGPLTQWHSHEGICISPFGGVTLTLQTPFWTCPIGAITVRTPAMLHVWIVDNPGGGPFAADLDPTVVQRLSA